MMAPQLISSHISSGIRKSISLLCGLILTTSICQAQSSPGSVLGALAKNVDIVGLETNFDPETGVATAVGEVHIKYDNVEISAGRAEYNSNTKDVIAHENVLIIKDGQLYRGETVTYNFETQDLKANDIRSGLPPVFYKTTDMKTNSGAMKADSGETSRIDGSGTYFTTHDSSHPNYHVTSKSLTIYPGDRVIMHDAKFYVGNLPVFWLPYFVQPLNHELGYFFQPGYDSLWGAFLLNQYGVMYGDHTLAKYHLDIRSARGLAGGVDLKSLRFADNNNFGKLLLYYAYDTSPETGTGGRDRKDLAPSKDRYRISFQHRIYLPGPSESTWYLDFDLNKLSDRFLLQDYYFAEFRANPQPDNNIALVKHSDGFVAMLWTRFQMNNFFHTDVRLPELAIDFTRQPLWHSGVFYQSENSLGFYKEKLSNAEVSLLQGKINTQQNNLSGFNSGLTSTVLGTSGSTTELAGTTFTSNNSSFQRGTPKLLTTRDQVQQDIANLETELSEKKFARLHSYHEFLYPMSFGDGNWFNVVPRFGVGANFYNDVSGGQKDFGSTTKGIFQAGLDVSGKFSRTWDDVKNHALGLDGLRHTITPYVNYSYLNSDPLVGFPGIDRLNPSTRPRPIDVPLFTAVDDLNTWNIARVGVRNDLQTKRDGTTYHWMGLNTYADIFFQDPEFDRKVSNLYNDFYFRPVPWLSLNIDSQTPIGSSDYNFTELNTSLSWMPNKSFSWTIGHNYLNKNPIFRDSSLIFSRIYTRLNENWGFSMNHIYEATDSTLQYQSYSISRDLTSWVVSVGGLVRNNVNAQKDYGIIVNFTLKDFPQISLPLDLDPNPTGRGGKGG